MSAIAGFGALKSRYEGTVASRNPITGVGHVAFDEPGFDVEGMRGRGTRGNARNEHADREAQIQASHKDLAQWSGSSQRHPTTEAAPEDNLLQAQTVSTIIKPTGVQESHNRMQDSPGALTPFGRSLGGRVAQKGNLLFGTTQ